MAPPENTFMPQFPTQNLPQLAADATSFNKTEPPTIAPTTTTTTSEHQQATPATSAPAPSSPQQHPKPSWSSTEQSSSDNHLTGIAALASANIPKDPVATSAKTTEERAADVGQTPNPSTNMFQYPVSKPNETQQPESSQHAEQRVEEPQQQQQQQQQREKPQALPSITTNLSGDGGTSAPLVTSAGVMQGIQSTAITPVTMGQNAFASNPLSVKSTTQPDFTSAEGNMFLQPQNQQPTLNTNFSSIQTPTSPFSQIETPTSAIATTPGGSRGKHQCHHCFQSFTRVHNLKSHLLTHSKSKPFTCSNPTCNAKFRRQHDLKRHQRLHSGERPFACPKCGRKFARGDALARHARGEAGCAGRRGSISGQRNEDGTLMDEHSGADEHDDPMHEFEDMIGGDAEGDISMLEAHPTSAVSATSSDGGIDRRRSLPQIKTSDLTRAQAPATPAYLQHNSTYPPISHHRSPQQSFAGQARRNAHTNLMTPSTASPRSGYPDHTPISGLPSLASSQSTGRNPSISSATAAGLIASSMISASPSTMSPNTLPPPTPQTSTNTQKPHLPPPPTPVSARPIHKPTFPPTTSQETIELRNQVDVLNDRVKTLEENVLRLQAELEQEKEKNRTIRHIEEELQRDVRLHRDANLFASVNGSTPEAVAAKAAAAISTLNSPTSANQVQNLSKDLAGIPGLNLLEGHQQQQQQQQQLQHQSQAALQQHQQQQQQQQELSEFQSGAATTS